MCALSDQVEFMCVCMCVRVCVHRRAISAQTRTHIPHGTPCTIVITMHHVICIKHIHQHTPCVIIITITTFPCPCSPVLVRGRYFQSSDLVCARSLAHAILAQTRTHIHTHHHHHPLIPMSLQSCACTRSSCLTS